MHFAEVRYTVEKRTHKKNGGEIIIKTKNITQKKAKQIQKYIEKNKKLPNYCTINGDQYSIYTTSYLMSRLIANTTKEKLEVVSIAKPSNMVSWKVDKPKVMKTDYMDMIKRFNNYCKNNKRVPAYIVTKQYGIKIGFELFVYCLAKIIVFYEENGYLPNYCMFEYPTNQNTQTSTIKKENKSKQSTSTNANLGIYKSSPHYLNTGCNNLGQCTSYYCGVHSVHQVLRKFGITKYSEAKLAGWAGTTTSGTDHQGINTAISKASNGSLKTKWINFSSLGSNTDARWKALALLISKADTDCIVHNLYRLKYGHYETIHQIDTKNRIIYVLNSLGDKCGTGYCGYIEKRTYDEFAKYIAATPGGQPSICLITK